MRKAESRSAKRRGGGTTPRVAPLVGQQSVAALVDEVARRLDVLDEPVREARELVAALLDVPRHWPSLHANKWVESDVWYRALSAADRRASGVPLAYAVRRASFRGLTLDVDERVLIPRPETELLVDFVLKGCAPGGMAIDVGTGSGAIAIALATEGKFDRVVATDISTDALAVARANAERYGCNLEFLPGDLLKALAVPPAHGREGGQRRRMAGVRAVVSNPPYIAFDEIAALPASVRDWEPSVALLSANNGMATTARLVRQAAKVLEPGGLLALEVDARRAGLVAEMVASHGKYDRVAVELDLTGRERYVLARRLGERE